jgi:hypothetical protein
MKKAIKYFLIFSGIVVLLLLANIAGLSLWFSDHMPKHLSYFNSTFKCGSKHVIKLDNATIQYTQGGNLSLGGKLHFSNVSDKKVFLSIDKISVTVELRKLLASLSMPINTNISGLKLNLNNITTDLNFVPTASNQSGDDAFEIDIFKEIKKIAALVNPKSMIHLKDIKVKNSVILRDDLTYNIEQNSTYKNDLYKIVSTIKNKDKIATIELTSLETEAKSSLSLKLVDLPVWIFSKLIPTEYNSPVLYNANQHLFLIANMNYTQDKNNPNGSLDINIENKDNSGTNDIKKFLLSVHNKELADTITLEKFQLNLNHNKGNIFANGTITHKDGLISKNSKLNLALSGSHIDLTSIGQIWPYGINKKTRNWMVSSIKKGTADKLEASLKIQDFTNLERDNFAVMFTFKNLDLKYTENFETVTNITGEANLNTHSALIKLKEADITASKIYNSSIEVIYKEKSMPLIIKANAEGRIKDFVHLMGEKNIKTFNQRGIKIQDTGGSTKAKIFIEIPLTKEITRENIKIDVVGSVNDLDIGFSNLLQIKQGHLDLKITNQIVSLIGRSLINSQPSRFEWVSNLGGHKCFDNRMVINSYIGPSAEFEKLLAGKLQIQEGEMLANLMYTNKESAEKIVFQLDLDDAHFSIPDIGLTKAKGIDSAFNFELVKEGEGNWKTNKFDLTSANINIKSNLELTHNFNLVNFNSHVQYDETLFNINLLSTPEKMDIKIHGPKVKFDKAHLLNLSNIGLYKQFTKTSGKVAAKEKKDPQKFYLSIQLDKAIMKNDVIFNNIIGNFECYKHQCVNSGLSMDINQKDKLKVTLQHGRDIDTWLFNATNASSFLKAFDTYRDIEGGTCSAKVQTVKQNHITSSPGSVFSGHLKIDNFHAVKTPMLATLILTSPFKDLSEASENQNLMHFNTLEMNFLFSFVDHNLKINRTFVKGSLLNITADGYIDIDDNKMNISGVLIPRYKINKLAYLFSEGKTPTGLVVTDYSIIGSTKDPEIKVSPLGITMSVLLNLPVFGIL